ITVAPAAFPLSESPVRILTPPQSQTVQQCRPVTFNVVAGGTAPFTYQWYRGTQAITGATASSYTLSSPQSADNNASFSVVIGNTASNVNYSVTSGVVTLTV